MHRTASALTLLLVALTGCTDDGGRATGGTSSSPSSPGSPSSSSSPASPSSPANSGSPSSPASEPGALESCPALFPVSSTPWVPSPPTTETEGRLAPDADPVTAVACRYRSVGQSPADRGPAPLVGEVALVGGLDRVRLDLRLPRRSTGQSPDCTAVGGPLVPHLVRFDYADGSLWLSSAQGTSRCQGSGNGVFVSGAYLGDALSASYDAGSWVSPGPGG